MKAGCDCLNACSGLKDYQLPSYYCGTMQVGDVCDDSMQEDGCVDIAPWPMIKQFSFNEVYVCGTMGGDPYLNATLPDYESGQCPTGTTPCLTTTSIENTLCYSPDDHGANCPITDI